MMPSNTQPAFHQSNAWKVLLLLQENELKIFIIEKISQVFNETAVPLICTPRRFVVNPSSLFKNELLFCHCLVAVQTECCTD